MTGAQGAAPPRPQTAQGAASTAPAGIANPFAFAAPAQGAGHVGAGGQN